MLIDKGAIGMGISAKTTAKITYLQQNIYSKLSNMHGYDKSKLYYQSQQEAIKLIREIINNNKIDCDLEKVKSVVLTNDNIKAITKEKEILLSFGSRVNDYHDDFIKYGLAANDTYVFNPLKYLNGLRKIVNAKIYEYTMAISIKKNNDYYIVDTNKGKIVTKEIVMACHYPFFIIPNFFPFKTYIEREFFDNKS